MSGTTERRSDYVETTMRHINWKTIRKFESLII